MNIPLRQGLLIATLAVIMMPVVCKASDEAAIEKLMAGSPFIGTASATGFTSTFELVFRIADRKLSAEIQKSSNGYVRVNGPVRFLSVKNGTVEFENEVGTSYSLHFDDSGTLPELP